jgi:2-oxoglutarate ferredoxin oxidoreductase subunit beta
MTQTALPTVSNLGYTRDSFVSGQDVRWCPGCGDYAILSVMQKTLADTTLVPREKHVFVSGIGCSSRFPYYMNTYGFHTVHGRAPAIATGLKCARPDLVVWVITGDGDGLSIGGNHLIHALRRNIDVNIILVNNRIYGLTKGQYSPTSEKGKVTKSSPYGSIDYPINPMCIAIAAEATFIARTVDTDPRHMGQVLARAAAHKGASFVEIYQNCVIFNKDAFQPIVGREFREDKAIYLEHGKPLVYGKAKDKGIILSGTTTETLDMSTASEEQKKNVLVHREDDPLPNYAYLLTQMENPKMPVPFGVFRCIEKPSYDEMMEEQNKFALQKKGEGKLEKLLYTEDAWTVTAEEAGKPS